MHKDFVTALAHHVESLETVRERLIIIEQRMREDAINRYESDYRDALMIQHGLREDHDSFAYRFAAEFLKDAQRAEDEKTDELKEYEAGRRRIEEEYLKAKEEETISIREETDARRRRTIEIDRETKISQKERQNKRFA